MTPVSEDVKRQLTGLLSFGGSPSIRTDCRAIRHRKKYDLTARNTTLTHEFKRRTNFERMAKNDSIRSQNLQIFSGAMQKMLLNQYTSVSAQSALTHTSNRGSWFEPSFTRSDVLLSLLSLCVRKIIIRLTSKKKH